MDAKRTYFVMCALMAILAIGVIGGAYGIKVLLQTESTKLVSLKAKADALSQQQTSLKKAKKDIVAYSDLYKVSKSIVPENKDQVQAVRQIVKLADENKVVLDSITFPASTLGATSGSSQAQVSAKPAAGSSATSGSKPSLSQLIAVPKIPGVYDLKLIITSSPRDLATYSELINFLSALENNRQTALVSTINISPDINNHNLFSFNLTLDTYIKP